MIGRKCKVFVDTGDGTAWSNPGSSSWVELSVNEISEQNFFILNQYAEMSGWTCYREHPNPTSRIHWTKDNVDIDFHASIYENDLLSIHSSEPWLTKTFNLADPEVEKQIRKYLAAVETIWGKK